MNIKKHTTIRKLFFGALCTLFLCCVFLGYSLVSGVSAKALESVPDRTEIIDPLYNFETYNYNESALNELARRILGDNRKTINDLISYAQNTARGTGEPINDKTSLITLKYGRFRYTNRHDRYDDLVWLPVYLSRSTGGDAILTLYLASTGGTTSQTESDSFTRGGTYTTDPTCSMPSNMYGRSAMRSFTMGNSGPTAFYAYYNGANHSSSFQTYGPVVTKDADNNKFMNFIAGSDYTGDLYDDIATPSEIPWQANESYAQYIGGDYTEHADWADYCWPNDAYDAPSKGSDKSPNYYEYKDKEGYADWKNDKVWLPSLTEVGTGDITGDEMNLNGVWQLTASQRANARNSWLRTADTSEDCYHMFATAADGSITSVAVSESHAIRPAIHLNLNKAITKFSPPVNLPDTVTSTYIGEAQSITHKRVTVPEDQVTWFKSGEMTVTFYSDKDCTVPAAPVNVGTYYLRVYLDNRSLYFKGEPSATRSKSAKFVVEKAKLGVKWTYEDNVPVKAEFVGQVYNRDLLAGYVPTLGIRYVSRSGSGNTYYDFDDLMRGEYRATAFILNEDVNNYNYELSADISDPLTSNIFSVGRKVLPLPYFVHTGTTEMNSAFKGTQYIQIANFDPRYMKVDVRAGADETAVDSEHFRVEGVSNDNIWTCSLSMVEDYYFTITFNDPNDYYFSWVIDGQTKEDYETNFDVEQKGLLLKVGRAQIEIDFVGLDTEWGTVNEENFTLNVRGLVNGDPSAERIKFRIWYEDFYGNSVDLTPDANGVYTVWDDRYPQGNPNRLPAAGRYTMHAAIADDGAYDTNYMMSDDGRWTSQEFTVVQTVSSFTPGDVFWRYKLNGQYTDAGNYYLHDSEATALELDFVDDFYEFSLTRNEDELRGAPYYVKATYSGDTRVRTAGVYKVTVKISAYYNNVDLPNLEEQSEFDIYFKINKSAVDLSGVKWAYDGTPLTYTGSAQKIMLDPDTLPAGFTATYTATGNATDAGEYTSTVSFILAEDYADNYFVPVADDPSTYRGTFEFTKDWTIAKAQITVEWVTTPSSSDALFVPTLKTGHSLVTYSYEHNVGGSWVATDSLVAAGASETFRVIATLKADVAGNFELVGNTPCEFEVASGKYPVTIHFEINGEVCTDGTKFVYNGSAMAVTAVVDSGDLEIKEYGVEYYEDNGGVKGTKLDGAPVNAGKYIAAVTAKYGNNSYLSPESATEVAFEITKADYDLSGLQLWYTHGDKVINVTYDAEQKKWVDAIGREVILSFEFDGTQHEITLNNSIEVPHESDKLTATLRNGRGINAGDYESVVTLTPSANYNSPTDLLAFPRVINWTITKAKINFEDVRWGYVDALGEEHDRDFDGEPFTFTRNENGVVKFTVGLIGLPKELVESGMISYFTTNKTNNIVGDGSAGGTGSVEEAGNSFSSVGDYETRVVFTGVFEHANFETFRAEDLPAFISQRQTWRIQARNLSKINFDDSWKQFDDRVHNLMELCGIPQNELVYFDTEIVFMYTETDPDNPDDPNPGVNVITNYPGYNGVANTAYHAGTYTIRLFQLSGDDETRIFWDYKTFTVAREKLDVIWYQENYIPVARVDGVYVSDMLGTKYTTAQGGVVTLAYIRSTDGQDLTFYAEPYVTDAYINDLEIQMGTDESGNVYQRRVQFKYQVYKPTANAIKIDKTKIFIENSSVEYNGAPIEFKISNWSYYQNFLEVSDGGLTKTEIGAYRVKLSFKGDADAYWDGESEETYRDSIILDFNITEPTSWALQFPELQLPDGSRVGSIVPWTGDAIEFKINGWIVLQRFVVYEVFRNNVSLGTDLTLTDAGNYRVVFSIPETSIGYWVADRDNPKRDYVINFRIHNPDEEVSTIIEPVLDKEFAEYAGGTAREFTVNDWTYYSQYVDITVSGGAVFADGVIRASDIGLYVVTVTIKDDLNVTFPDESRTATLTFRITPSTSGDVDNPLPKPSLDKTTAVYTGEEITFSVEGWASTYSDYLTITCDNEKVTVNGNGTVTVTEAGEYEIILSFKEDAKAVWNDGTQKEPFPIKFTVTSGDVPGPDDGTEVDKPVMTVLEKEYTGADITFVIDNLDAISEYVTVTGLTQKDIGEYTVTVALKDKNANCWKDGTIADVTFTVVIKQASLVVGDGVGGDGDGKLDVNNSSGDKVDIDEYLDIKHYYDPVTGEEVDVKDLVDGKDYDVEYGIKDDKLEEFKKNFANADEIIKKLSETRYRYTYTKSGENPGGINWTLIIIIAAVVLVIIIIIIIIVVVKRRNADDGYDDYDDYDEYDDYDDDDDDYDDDYDY